MNGKSKEEIHSELADFLEAAAASLRLGTDVVELKDDKWQPMKS